jgi:hypothetical protein
LAHWVSTGLSHSALPVLVACALSFSCIFLNITGVQTLSSHFSTYKQFLPEKTKIKNKTAVVLPTAVQQTIKRFGLPARK